MRSTEEVRRMYLEEQTKSTDAAEAAEARRRLAEDEDVDDLIRRVHERQGRA